MRRETTKVLVGPIARQRPGADGLVRSLRHSRYDDIASLYFYDGQSHLHYLFDDKPDVGNIREAEAKLLSKESLESVLDEMKPHAA